MDVHTLQLSGKPLLRLSSCWLRFSIARRSASYCYFMYFRLVAVDRRRGFNVGLGWRWGYFCGWPASSRAAFFFLRAPQTCNYSCYRDSKAQPQVKTWKVVHKVMDSFRKMIRMKIIRFREFAYNRKTGEVLGRTFKSWGKYLLTCVNV